MTKIDEILQCAIEAGILDSENRWAVFFDLDALHSRFHRLQRAFPADACHAVAIKANPLVAILEQLVDDGAALEAASSAEVQLARRAGADEIVFDSPAKTDAELARALDMGVYVNADNLDELQRIDRLNPPADARIGIRINPVVGSGDIEATSVATEASKFGVSLVHKQRALLDAFEDYSWLRGLHVHTGSQGCGVDLLVEGVRRCVAFAEKLERRLGDRRIDTIDIGGGLGVAYRPHAAAPTIEEYADALRDTSPQLFGRRWSLITEFGRWLHAPCAFAVSRVEYVKDRPRGPTAVIHFGADLLLRRAYRPRDWYHRLSIHDPSGEPSQRDETHVTIAGPLCFSGDVIADSIRLARPATGDLVVAHDVGAYTWSMWSRYCSRHFPRVVGVSRCEQTLQFETLHSGETDADLVAFWEP